MTVQGIEVLAIPRRHIHLCDIILRAKPQIVLVANHAHHDVLHSVDALYGGVFLRQIQYAKTSSESTYPQLLLPHKQRAHIVARQ